MKRRLLLERDFLLFDAWDALQNLTIPPQPDQLRFNKKSGVGITLSVYGNPGISDLTGEKTIEDMEVWWGDSDITNGLPESFLQTLVHEALENV